MEKSWVDENMNNCFMLYAKDFNIAWGGDPSYWHFPTLNVEESSEVSSLKVAELLKVCWLDINGRFETSKLSPETEYEVVFIVMIKKSAYGWDTPINLSLTLPGGILQHHTEILMEKERGSWIEIPVGDFITSSLPAGDMEFSLNEHGGRWKRGLVIKGVSIKPKTNTSSVQIDDSSRLETNPSVPIDDSSRLETNHSVPIDDSSRLETNPSVPKYDSSRPEQNIRRQKMIHLDPKHILLQLVLLLLLLLVYYYYYYFGNNR